ncbi:MAG: hypothetical protein EXQ48_01690 [Acidobacteria bacterium]|nr:hypothetical protein [Acidobacteriota bacterium]
MTRCPCLFPLLLAALISFPATAVAQNRPHKEARAYRLKGHAIRVDGRVDEDAWEQAQPVSDFVQKEPVEGAPPSHRMEVRFLYDADALYVGFRVWSGDANALKAPLGRRDVGDQAEHVIVSLDTYRDRRTAYTFGVTASGVRLDRFHGEDQQEGADLGFDPVWEARTDVNATGWTAELWIPFSQLRFNDAPTQTWGLNVGRFTPTLNEEDYWVAIPRTVTAWSSRFGDLVGLDDVRPARRLELLPYTATSSSFTSLVDAGNPFSDGRTMGGRVGLDMKLGLGSNLTLNVALNPDFGQVEADPAEVNLSAFETIFPEKRPFFTEGANLMNLGVRSGANLFNSRRIGARPIGPASGDYVAYPDTSTILGAAKLTGRTASGMSIGLLSAVTAGESAHVSGAGGGSIRSIRVAPRTVYGVGRVQQEFGPHASTVSVMGTFVGRDLGPGDALTAFLPRRAVGLGSDAVIRLKGGEYEATFLGLMNHVSGEATAIERLQRASAHYFQRPDREYSRIDPARTAMTGYKVIAGFERRSGRHWLWDTEVTAISPGLETNDIGRTLTGDGLRHILAVRYRETQPGKVFRTYSVSFNVNNEWTYDKDHIVRLFRPSAAFTLKNFWTISTVVSRNLAVLDPVLARGGPLMQRPASWTATATLANAAVSQTRWIASGTAISNEDRGYARRASLLFSFRPSPRWQLSVEPALNRTNDVQQYIATVAGGRPETYGRRYVFSSIDRTTLSGDIRMGVTLRPDLNIDVYAEPFASSGRYADFGELLRGGTRERLAYGTSGTTLMRDANGDWAIDAGSGPFTLKNPDFAVRSLRSNVVLRWEWKPGSTLYVVWQQDHERRDVTAARAGIDDLLGAFAIPGRTILAIKSSFWIPVR